MLLAEDFQSLGVIRHHMVRRFYLNSNFHITSHNITNQNIYLIFIIQRTPRTHSFILAKSI